MAGLGSFDPGINRNAHADTHLEKCGLKLSIYLRQCGFFIDVDVTTFINENKFLQTHFKLVNETLE